MSLGTDRFGGQSPFATYDPHRRPGPTLPVTRLQCRGCGFETQDGRGAPCRCPKCGGRAYERIAIPGSMLELTERT
jgi:predicted Zn-ribbon and HTH transcriptional regulator